MADELQALLDHIAEEELKKVDAEKEKILADARKEAAELVQKARQEAAGITENAMQEAAKLTQKGEEALRQASRDVLLSLRGELEKRVERVTGQVMRETLAGANLVPVLVNLVSAFIKADGNVDDLKVLLSPTDLSIVEGAVKAALSDDMKAHVEFAPARAIAGGFRLSFPATGVVYDFTDAALAETVAGFLSPKIASILTEG